MRQVINMNYKWVAEDDVPSFIDGHLQRKQERCLLIYPCIVIACIGIG